MGLLVVDFVMRNARHALSGLGAVLIAKGWSDSATVDSVASGVTQIVGGVASWAVAISTSYLSDKLKGLKVKF